MHNELESKDIFQWTLSAVIWNCTIVLMDPERPSVHILSSSQSETHKQEHPCSLIQPSASRALQKIWMPPQNIWFCQASIDSALWGFLDCGDLILSCCVRCSRNCVLSEPVDNHMLQGNYLVGANKARKYCHWSVIPLPMCVEQLVCYYTERLKKWFIGRFKLHLRFMMNYLDRSVAVFFL